MLGAVVVYIVWGLAVPILLGAGTIGFISFATGGALFAGTILFARAIPFVEARLRRQQLQLTTDLRGLSGREFETLVQELFEREGWQAAHTGGHGQADGNIDLSLRRGSDTRLVQCKHWTAATLASTRCESWPARCYGKDSPAPTAPGVRARCVRPPSRPQPGQGLRRGTPRSGSCRRARALNFNAAAENYGRHALGLPLNPRDPFF